MKILYSLISLFAVATAHSTVDFGPGLQLKKSGSAASGSAASTVNINNKVVNLEYVTLDENYYPGWLSHPLQGFIFNATMANQTTLLTLDFHYNQTFVGLKGKSDFGITCNDSNKDTCKVGTSDTFGQEIYNRNTDLLDGQVSLWGGSLLPISFATDKTTGGWYFKKPYGLMGFAPGSAIWPWLKTNAKPTGDYYINFNQNCNPDLKVRTNISNDSFVPTICPQSMFTLGATTKPSTTFVNLTQFISAKDSGNYYSSWQTTNITATFTYTKPTYSNVPNTPTPTPSGSGAAKVPSSGDTVNLIEKGDTVCIVPDGNFFIAYNSTAGKIQNATYLTLSATGTVCPNIDNSTQNCKMSTNVNSGPQITFTINGGGSITAYPREYLRLSNESGTIKLQSAVSLLTAPSWTKGVNTNGRTYFGSDKPCGSSQVALGKHFFSTRPWTIKADKDFKDFAITWGSAPAAPGGGGGMLLWIIIAIAVVVVLVVVILCICGGGKSNAPLEEPLDGEFTVKFEN